MNPLVEGGHWEFRMCCIKIQKCYSPLFVKLSKDAASNKYFIRAKYFILLVAPHLKKRHYLNNSLVPK